MKNLVPFEEVSEMFKVEFDKERYCASIAKGLVTMRSVVIITTILLAFSGCSKKDSKPKKTKTKKTVQPRKRPKPVKPPTFEEKLFRIGSFCKAVEFLRPKFEDGSKLSKGTILLIRYMLVVKANLFNVALFPHISYGEFNKDPIANRGKTVSGEGKVIQIRAIYNKEKTQRLFYEGTMYFGKRNPQHVYFVALGDTTDVNANDKETFYGIAAQQYSYKNTGGGTTNALLLVGFFATKKNTDVEAVKKAGKRSCASICTGRATGCVKECEGRKGKCTHAINYYAYEDCLKWGNVYQKNLIKWAAKHKLKKDKKDNYKISKKARKEFNRIGYCGIQAGKF